MKGKEKACLPKQCEQVSAANVRDSSTALNAYVPSTYEKLNESQRNKDALATARQNWSPVGYLDFIQ